MRKITELTPAQAELLPRWREEWLGIGTCTEPADWKTAEEAITDAYAVIGRPKPIFLHVASPLMACATLTMLKRASGGGQLWDQLRGQLSDQLGGQLSDQLRGQLSDQLRGQLRGQLWGQLAIECANTTWWGQLDGYWVAFYRFCAEIGVVYPESAIERLRIHERVCRSCGWWWPRDGLCVISDRPEVCHLTARGLHNEDGPAIRFRDGWSVYAVNNVRVPSYVIERPAEITAEKIEAERNAEIRRVLIQRYRLGEEVSGAAAWLCDSGAEVLDDDPRFGRLLRKSRPTDSDVLVVEVVNSTPEPDGSSRLYHLRVHPECRPLYADGRPPGPRQPLTARAAIASTFGLLAHEYAPRVET